MTQHVGEMKTLDLDALLRPGQAVETYLAKFFQQRTLPANLRTALEYAVLGGGKRLRPVLVVHACQVVSGRPFDNPTTPATTSEADTHALTAAAAIEMIHCFSLIHDDLPAMDDDDLRRGRPTLHKHAGEAMAILAGDALTSLPFELITTRIPERSLAAALTHELSTATTEMIAGQVYDTLPPDKHSVDEARLTDLQRLQRIHHHKTGALLQCACRMGGLCGHASDAQLDALTRYAKAIGLMFQVVDDLLDVTQTHEALGKASNKDAEQGKLTYPGLLGIDASRAEVLRLQTEAHEALADLGDAAQPLRDLCDYMAVRDR